MMGDNERHIERERIARVIEDIVMKMHKTGKSFQFIAMYMLLTEAEVQEAFERYQQRLATGDRDVKAPEIINPR